jgi:hypothetical protein
MRLQQTAHTVIFRLGGNTLAEGHLRGSVATQPEFVTTSG